MYVCMRIIPPASGVRWFRVLFAFLILKGLPLPVFPPRGPNMVVRMVVGPCPQGPKNK